MRKFDSNKLFFLFYKLRFTSYQCKALLVIKNRQFELSRYGLVRNLNQKQQHCTATATEVGKVCITINDYAIKHFHFSNLKRPNVIKVRCRAEICITFAAIYILHRCLQFVLNFRLTITATTGRLGGLADYECTETGGLGWSQAERRLCVVFLGKALYPHSACLYPGVLAGEFHTYCLAYGWRAGNLN